jgi:hypothetical protein
VEARGQDEKGISLEVEARTAAGGSARGQEKANRGAAEDRVGGQRARSMGWEGGGADEIEAGM